MSPISRNIIPILLVVFVVGWWTYPGWYNEWYSTWPEGYAFPASLSNPHDPKWGFWFW